MKSKHSKLSVYGRRSRGGEQRENNGSLPDLLTSGAVNLVWGDVVVEGGMWCRGSGRFNGSTEGR